MKRLIAICLLAGCLPCLLSAADAPWLFYSATKAAAQAPAIDGRLNDACWQGIEPTRPLVCIGGATSPVPTKVMACWDEQNLYIAFVCEEPLMTALKQNMAAGVLLPFGESVEIFLDPDADRFTYMQLRVDIMGNKDIRPDGDALDPMMNQRWRSAVALDEKRWTVEAAIPLSLMTQSIPSNTTVWGCNFNRTRGIGLGGNLQCWSDTQGPFHSPGRFGDMIFVSCPVFLRSHFAQIFETLWTDIGQLRQRAPATIGQYDGRIQSLKAEDSRFLDSLVAGLPLNAQEAAMRHAQGMDATRQIESLWNEIALHFLAALAKE